MIATDLIYRNTKLFTMTSAASALASSSVMHTLTKWRYAKWFSEWQAAHTCLYTWYPRRILFSGIAKKDYKIIFNI